MMDNGEKKSNTFLFYLIFIWIIILAITTIQRASFQYGGFISGNAVQANVTSPSGSVSFTVEADADNDGVNDTVDALVGNLSSVKTSGIENLNLSIGGNFIINATYSRPYDVTFYNGTSPLVNFTHNFSPDAQIFLRRIVINVTNLSIIVNTAGQLLPNERKTIWIVNNTFSALCVKDLEINSTAGITSGCTGNNETSLTLCLNTNIESVTINNITCAPDGTRLRISNLKHSGIIGTITSSGSDSGSSSSSSSSSGGGGGGGGIRTTIDEVVQVNIFEIERLLEVGETATEVVLLRNIWKNKVTVEALVEGDIYPYVSIMGLGGEKQKSKIFELNALESKTLTLLIEALHEGIYSGNIILKRDNAIQKISLRLVVKGKEKSLLGLEVIILDDIISPGSDLKYNINMYNLGETAIPLIDLTSQITKNGTNTTIAESKENIPFSKSIKLTRELTTPSASDTGPYFLRVTATYEGGSHEGGSHEGGSHEGGSVTVINPFFVESAELRVPAAITRLLPPFIREYLPLIMTTLVLIFIFIVSGYYIVYLRKKLFEKMMQEKMKNSPYPFPTFSLLPKSKFAYTGHIADTYVKTYLDYRQLNMHTLIAGSTGCGKTMAGMVIGEELLKRNLPVVVFDPTGQWTGFFEKNKNKEMKAAYRRFSLSRPHAFSGTVIEVTPDKTNIDVNHYLKQKGLTIFKLSGLKPRDADMFIADALKQIYHANWAETPSARALLVLDEVHRLLPKYGGRKAYLLLEQAVREFRKWGIGILMISQVLTDFKGAIRGNIGTEIQMRTRYEGDIKRVRERHGSSISNLIPKLPTGLGMLECPEYNRGNPYFVEWRPILHSQFKLPEKELKRYRVEKPILITEKTESSQKSESTPKKVPEKHVKKKQEQ